jgi:type II secretory pathway component PulF
MPIFVYKAKKENADTVTGDIFARDSEEAVDLLAQQGFVPIALEERSSAGGGLLKDLKIASVKLKEMYAFTRQLAGLLKSGVALLQALEILGRQTKNTYFARVLSEVALGVRNGRSFSSVLADYPAVFVPLFVTMARAGEESGRLRELLANMAVYFRKQDEVASRVRAALAYPAFMLGVGVMTVVFILTFVMPKLSILFSGMNTRLPWPTVLIMSLSNVIRHGWPYMLGFFCVGLMAVRSFDQAARLRQWCFRVVAVVPFLKNFMIKVDIERFARTLGLLLESGIPILKALEVAMPVVSSYGLRHSLRQVYAAVEGGTALGEALREVAVLPEMFASLIAVGEESGELSGALKDIADTYEQDISETTKTFTSLLEPLMILVVGGAVGFIIFAMLMPIFQMDIFAR